jgi:hypothetical protein
MPEDVHVGGDGAVDNGVDKIRCMEKVKYAMAEDGKDASTEKWTRAEDRQSEVLK